VAGSFAFEVMEHLWDPVAAVREMIRITRPGGFILLSMPNRFSLDLHLAKKVAARAFDQAMALIRRGVDATSEIPYVNVMPTLDGEVYPDCDMISAVIPQNFAARLDTMGCQVEFWDTFYMCAHRQGSTTTLDFQRNAARPFFRHFGDHVLMLARKQ
jgi:SAM-dependent methyltransferase